MTKSRDIVKLTNLIIKIIVRNMKGKKK